MNNSMEVISALQFMDNGFQAEKEIATPHKENLDDLTSIDDESIYDIEIIEKRSKRIF